MGMLNEYSGLFSLIAAIASIVAIFVSIWLSKQSSKQIDGIHKDWDKKRKYNQDYSASLEFQDSINRK